MTEKLPEGPVGYYKIGEARITNAAGGITLHEGTSEPANFVLTAGRPSPPLTRHGWFEFHQVGDDRWFRFRFAADKVEFEFSDGLVLDDAQRLFLEGIRLMAETTGFVVLWPKYL